jgi:hypothetical protein
MRGNIRNVILVSNKSWPMNIRYVNNNHVGNAMREFLLGIELLSEFIEDCKLSSDSQDG